MAKIISDIVFLTEIVNAKEMTSGKYLVREITICVSTSPLKPAGLTYVDSPVKAL